MTEQNYQTILGRLESLMLEYISGDKNSIRIRKEMIELQSHLPGSIRADIMLDLGKKLAAKKVIDSFLKQEYRIPSSLLTDLENHCYFAQESEEKRQPISPRFEQIVLMQKGCNNMLIDEYKRRKSGQRFYTDN